MKHFPWIERSMLPRALWCGLHAAIIAMLVALNLIPTQQVRYTVAVPIVASAERIRGLKVEAAEKRTSLQLDGSTERGELPVLKCIVLDNHQPDLATTPTKTSIDTLHRARAYFIYDHIPSTQETARLLMTMTGPKVEPILSEDSQKKLRWANWKRDMLAHVQSELHSDLKKEVEKENSESTSPPHATSSSSETAGESPSISERVVSSQPSLQSPIPIEGIIIDESSDENDIPSRPGPFQVASLPLRSALNRTSADLETDLQQSLAELEKEIASLRTGTSESKQRGETLALASRPTFRPFTSRITNGQALGLISIGITCWLAMAWFYVWVARSGGSDPRAVVAWLERIGIPSLSGKLLHRPVPSQDNPNAIRMIRALEWILLGIAFWIAVRFALDSNFRWMMIEQPLSGLGRLWVRI